MQAENSGYETSLLTHGQADRRFTRIAVTNLGNDNARDLPAAANWVVMGFYLISLIAFAYNT
jgi:hypothetical protein